MAWARHTVNALSHGGQPYFHPPQPQGGQQVKSCSYSLTPGAGRFFMMMTLAPSLWASDLLPGPGAVSTALHSGRWFQAPALPAPPAGSPGSWRHLHSQLRLVFGALALAGLARSPSSVALEPFPWLSVWEFSCWSFPDYQRGPEGWSSPLLVTVFFKWQRNYQ